MNGDNYPKFRLDASRFDQSNFKGRLLHFLNVTDPRTLFVSKKRLQESIDLLELYKGGKLPKGTTDKDLWEAQKIKQAIIHPDTNQIIPMPFRMSGFVPFGSPIVVGLLLPNPTLKQTVFWQWLNQSHNACVNYSNRNATKQSTVSKFIIGYVGAVTSAVSIAVGLSLMIKKTSGLTPSMKLIVQKFVPFPAVATASTCNVVLMRNNELHDGIEVFDSQNKVIGTSKVAARQALIDTAITRMFLPAPLLLIPALVMTFAEKTQLLIRRPRLHLPINASVTTLSFALALPIAIALFPQISSISKSQLEDEIQNSSNEEILFYNKGL
ncbi:hypothetical protein HELRODRAFT_99850 [Helobdella robusta]|uniref:Sidoreflexin n=1 Tax=Helobdella robusta TaxID=6412 RepID=T1G9V6_HELRO|nr:hypothetical protein HELRODRAFT_99850 [Helobdella robusta]ESO03542.1 hypothetical protein HELRODRAFT_99850 [Helobdella robusta]